MAPGTDSFVMFGHGNILGELIELLDLLGARLRCVVQNQPEVPRSGHPDLATRLARFRDPAWNPQHVNGLCDVEVIPLDDYVSRTGDRCVMGFTGAKGAPLVALLRERHGISFATLVHPTAIISPTARLGEGCVVHALAMVGSGAELGAHCYVNKGALVGHDSVVGDHSVIAPGAKIGGQGRIGRGVFIGMNATVTEDRVVADHSVVGAGAVVIHDVPARVLVAGVPATLRKTL